MANLIEYIQSQVYENSTEDISGSIMQQVLTRMASDEGVVNVHTISGQTPFADYNNAQAARDAVPAGFKKLGLIITYKLSSGWYIDEFIGSATSGWSTASNWKCLGPISVSQNASTGKTTITIGSESFDVATQPVSVSQNSETGHTDITIGETSTPVASVVTSSAAVKEVYLLGDTDLYKDFHFQWLRTYPSSGNQVYQCRIAATLISTDEEMEVARIWGDTVLASSLLTVLELKEASGSGIRGFVVLNGASNWGADYVNDTSPINIEVATNLGANGMISSYIDSLKQVVLPDNPIRNLSADNAVITVGDCVLFWGGGYQYINPTQLSIADNHTSLYLKYDTTQNVSNKWGFAVISNNNPRDKKYIYILVGEFNYKQLTWSIWQARIGEGYFNYFTGTGQISPTRYFGIYVPCKIQLVGFRVKLYNNTEPVNVYVVNLDTGVADLLTTFSASQLSVGINKLLLPVPTIIGDREQVVITGQYCYESGHNKDAIYYSRKIVEYFPDSKKAYVAYSSNVFAIEPIFDKLSDLPVGITNVGNNGINTIEEIKGFYSLDYYTSAFNQPDKAIFRYIPFPCSVSSVSVQVNGTSADINVYGIDLETGVATLLKSVTPSATGAMTITLDTPYDVTKTKQIAVSGILGYRYNANAGYLGYPAYYYYLNTHTTDTIQSPDSPVLVDFGLEYGFSVPVELSDANFKSLYDVNANVADLMRRMLPIEGAVSSIGAHETITVNIADYNNNLMSVFNAISPSATKHYVILIPEGTYNVDEWFTEEQIENSNETGWRGLELLDYTKLLGVGRRDKIILQWMNSDNNTHWDYISTLNTQHHNELENLTIKANNIRYCVHDDIWDGQDRYLRIKNCVFESYNRVSRAWGAGCNGGYDAIFENCQFIMHYYAPYDVDATSGYVEPMCLHDNYHNVDKLSFLTMRNCRFVLPYKTIKYRMEDNADSWEEITYNSSYPMYDETKTDYAINDCVNMPDNTSHSYKCLYANSQIPPYMTGRPSLNIGFGSTGANGCLYATIEGCKMDTYLAASDYSRSTGFGNKFGSSPVLWTELTESKDIVFDFLDNE